MAATFAFSLPAGSAAFLGKRSRQQAYDFVVAKVTAVNTALEGQIKTVLPSRSRLTLTVKLLTADPLDDVVNILKNRGTAQYDACPRPSSANSMIISRKGK